MLGHSYNQYLLRKTKQKIAELKRQLKDIETEPQANVLPIGHYNKIDGLYQARVSGEHGFRYGKINYERS